MLYAIIFMARIAIMSPLDYIHALISSIGEIPRFIVDHLGLVIFATLMVAAVIELVNDRAIRHRKEFEKRLVDHNWGSQ